MTQTPDPVQRYLDSASDAGRAAYLAVRELVLRHAPSATETLSYGMPTFVVDGSRLLHASAWTEHLAIYPLPDERDLDPQAATDLEAHSSGASTLKLPYLEPFPTALVDAVVRAHVARVADGR
ncbi:MAG TPA: DUF1801 domain-containing protein [Ornithinibacter sp.]|nr:DUF1801 domain-containing protein [Ornithinibacter sp.]